MLTLIDLAGYEATNCIGRESAENSMLQLDTSKNNDKLNYTKMSDCGRLAKNVKLLEESISKDILASLHYFKSFILSLNSNKKSQLRHDETTKQTLVELFRQNLKSDYQIYIIGHIDVDTKSPENGNKAADTLSFCNSFKNIVGLHLAREEEKRNKTTKDETNSYTKSILKELKQEVLDEEKKLFTKVLDTEKMPEKVYLQDIMKANILAKNKETSKRKKFHSMAPCPKHSLVIEKNEEIVEKKEIICIPEKAEIEQKIQLKDVGKQLFDQSVCYIQTTFKQLKKKLLKVYYYT